MAQISPFDIPFDKLPNPRQVWVGAPGSLEEGLGKISLLTPEVVAEAAAEIKTGVRVTLGWEMTKLELANLNRQPCQHHIISLLNGLAFDDVYIMNPRALPDNYPIFVKTAISLTVDLEQSSQWDGLRHFSQPVPATDGKSAERVFYGGTTASEILNRSNDRIGMQYWARQGITGPFILHICFYEAALWCSQNRANLPLIILSSQAAEFLLTTHPMPQKEELNIALFPLIKSAYRIS